MVTDTIYRLSNNKFSPWLQDKQLENPNGLLIEGENLVVASWGVMTDGFVTAIPGHLKTVSLSSKIITDLGDATAVGNLDGIEPDGDGNYFVTDWMNGKLLYITQTGLSSTLLTLTQGSADLTLLPEQNLIIIPMMVTGNLVAYTINK
jgi:sugar lactone lactonase YvrE